MADKLSITPSESVTMISSGPDALEVEGSYGAEGKPPPKHFHPDQDEHFEVIEGLMKVRVDDEEMELKAGDMLDIPRGAVHQMWNHGISEARVKWLTTPPGRTEQWFRAIDRLHREGRVGKSGEPGPLAFAALLDEFDDVFRLAVGPQAVVQGMFRLVAPIGRARGYLPDDLTG